MFRELRDVFQEVAERDEDRVLVLTGAGGAFSAGADLGYAALGVTVTSVIFEHRRTTYQLLSYAAYDSAAVEHLPTVQAIEHGLRGAGIGETEIPAMALRLLQQQIDLEALATGFRDSFFIISFCFLLALVPLIGVVSQRTRQQQ
jgi:hypothetical protein